MRVIVFLFLVFTLPVYAFAGALPTSQGTLQITRIAAGLKAPWGLAFLPEGGFLVTQRGGQIFWFDAGGERRKIRGAPKVRVEGQGGLLDVVVARDFAKTREVFLTFAKAMTGGSGTALAVARLDKQNAKLENLKVIFQMSQGSSSSKHFGSRVAEAPDGTLFLTIGERGKRNKAQDLSVHNGKVVRIARSGKIPQGNPFAGQVGVQPEIWSFGHRNPQGAAFDRQGRFWVVEHGPKGGDEINLVKPGRNYGWPVIGYGKHYSGAKVGVGTHKTGMEQPAFYWDPSIAPSGMMIYSGKLWPEWKGDLFVGSLKFDYIARIDRKNETLSAGEKIRSGETKRVRDVREAPDGSIWFLSVDKGAVYRIAP